jgi:deoxyribonuclease V
MKAVLDVHYIDDLAQAACVTFNSWTDAESLATSRITIPGPRPYRPGHFFERELPPLLAVLEDCNEEFSHIIVDGFVHLKSGKPGLGASLHDALPYPPAVIGVAKSPLAAADRFEPVLRGRSSKPLFVSAVGIDLDEATAAIDAMHGPYRIPTLLRLADQIARGVRSGIDGNGERLL